MRNSQNFGYWPFFAARCIIANVHYSRKVNRNLLYPNCPYRTSLIPSVTCSSLFHHTLGKTPCRLNYNPSKSALQHSIVSQDTFANLAFDRALTIRNARKQNSSKFQISLIRLVFRFSLFVRWYPD